MSRASERLTMVESVAYVGPEGGEPIYPCLECGRHYASRQAFGGHVSHCRGTNFDGRGALESRPVDAMPGFVYIVASLEGPLRFKVGYTAGRTPNNRLRGLRGGSPVALVTVGVWEGSSQDEWDLQEFLKALGAHVHCEWFDIKAIGDAEKWIEARPLKAHDPT